MKSLVLVLFCLLGSVSGLWRRRFQMDNQRSNLARESAPADTQRWYNDQTLDHFDGHNTKTWKQRWFVNETFWDGTGSVFICVGGEGPALQPTVVITGDAHCADMINLAPQHKALILALEHRYYGQSLPTSDFSTDNLKWLSSQQALSDLAQFHGYISQLYNLTAKNRWVSWGGSYPGMLSAWFRLKFPHLVWAAVSSSSPVQAQANMQGYNDVVAQSMAAEDVGGSDACANTIATVFSQIGQQLYTYDGRRQLEKTFSVCRAGQLEDVNNQAQFTEDLSYVFPVQSNDPACTTIGCNISSCCNILLNSSYGVDPMTRLAYLAKLNFQPCLNADYNLTLKAFTDTSLVGGQERIWTYQTCAEFGFYQTCDPDSKCIFTKDPHLNTLQSYYDLCQIAFGINGTQTEKRIDFSNEFYGGDQFAGSRVLFVNGEIDPWHSLSVLQPLSTDVPALWVPGASHHFWTHPFLPTDSAEVNEARQEIFDQVNSWLSLPSH